MLASVHVSQVGWHRRTDLEAEHPDWGQIWQAPAKDGVQGRIKAFGASRANVLTTIDEDLKVPNYSGW